MRNRERNLAHRLQLDTTKPDGSVEAKEACS